MGTGPYRKPIQRVELIYSANPMYQSVLDTVRAAESMGFKPSAVLMNTETALAMAEDGFPYPKGHKVFIYIGGVEVRLLESQQTGYASLKFDSLDNGYTDG